MNLLGLPTHLFEIPEGPEGTWTTLTMMKNIVSEFKKNPVIREFTTRLVQELQGKDWYGEIHTLFNFVRNNIRYVMDVNDVETIQTPIATLKLRHGDCDDMSTLLATMLETIGYQTKFTAIGFEPDSFAHVYLEVLVNDINQWISLDPTEPNEMGWSAGGYCCIMSC